VFRGRRFIEQNDPTVVLTLIKDLRRNQDALARGDAPGDVDLYEHAVSLQNFAAAGMMSRLMISKRRCLVCMCIHDAADRGVDAEARVAASDRMTAAPR
jgi:hypothetical protein